MPNIPPLPRKLQNSDNFHDLFIGGFRLKGDEGGVCGCIFLFAVGSLKVSYEKINTLDQKYASICLLGAGLTSRALMPGTAAMRPVGEIQPVAFDRSNLRRAE